MEEQKSQTIQVTTKDPKKVEAGKKLAEYNRKKREELKEGSAHVSKQKGTQQQKDTPEYSVSYGIGGVMVLGLIGGVIYYVVFKSGSGPVEEGRSKDAAQGDSSEASQPNKFFME